LTIKKIALIIKESNLLKKNDRMKLKTRKAAFKRVKIKKNNLERKKAYKSHLLRNKSSKRLRRLGKVEKIHKADFSSYRDLLPYSS
jgi:large subunit ribosomal protein L35